MCRILIIIAFCVYTYKASSQSLYKDITRNKITLTHKEGNSIFFISEKDNSPKAKAEKVYYWYGGGKLNITQGGYSGKLLNGSYDAFYPNKNLAEQGPFNKGLKKGEWKTWNTDGNLKTITFWRNGSLNGRFSEYDSIGRLSKTGYYNDGQLDGKVKNYHSADSMTIQKYKDGKLVIKKDKVKNPDSRYNKAKRYVGEQFRKLKPKRKNKKEK